MERAKIVMLSSEGLTDAEISVKVDLHESIVGKWRRRFSDAYETLEGIEAEAPEKMNEAVTDILLDKPRKGAPETYDANQRAFIITMACQNPGYSVAAEPPFRSNGYRESGTAYRQAFS